MGKDKTVKKKIKMPDIKSLIFGAPKTEAPVLGSRFPNGTQALVPVVDIQQGVIITEDGRYLKILEVLPTNFYLKSTMEQQNIIYYMASYLRIAPVSLQIMVQTGRADIDAYCDQMQRCYENETNEMCRDMILEDAQLVNYLAANEAVTRKFFLVFQYEGTAGDFSEIAKQMAEVAETALQYLDYCGLEVLRHEQYDDFLFRTLYTVYHRRSAFEVDHKALFAEVAASIHGTDEEPPEDMSEEDKLGILTVQDVLAPTECDLTNKEYIIIDGTYYAYLYVSGYGYPTQAALSWLSPLVELGDGISISYYLNKRRKEQILPKVAKTTMFNRSRMRDVEDTRSDFEQLDDAISSGMYIKEQLNREGEEFFYMNTLIEVTSFDPETLEQRIKQVQNRCAAMNMTIRRADYCHEQCFKSMLPLCKLDPDIDRKSRRNILTQGAAGAFPFSSFELCDDKGILMGINLHNNSTVILDNFNSDIYSNGNMAIFGMTGAGKTYTILLMAMRLRMNGVQVFVIAPEKGFEYRGPCEALGGQYIKLARGSTDCINIMDIRRTTMDIDDNLQGHESRKDSVMLDVVQDVKTYFQLRYPAMTPEERYMLNAAIIECYGNFGITKDNESILNPDGSFKEMPTLVDLYPIVNSIPELKNIAIIIRDLVESGLGGKTNVDLRSGFIVMDTSASREEDIAATTFLATVFFRDEMSKSRTRKKAVFGDELWIIAGKEGNDQASEFVIKLVKTIRGYGGIFVSCTQNTIDYFALNNGKFGDAVLNNSRLKLLLQMEEPEALKLKEKIGLSDEEVMQILRCGRGQGLLCAGKNRIAVEIRSSQTQYDLITTNRADLEKRAKENAYD